MPNDKNKISDWILILGQLLAQLSDRMTGLGLIWMVTVQFGEKWVTWYLVMGGIPHFLLSPWTGKVIQSVGALRVVIFTDWIRAIIYLVASLFLSRVQSVTDLAFVMALVFLSNCFAAFFNPGILSLPVELEEGSAIQKLTARLSTVTSLTTVIGPILGMICLQQFGLRGLFIITFFAYLISGICAWTLRNRVKKIQIDGTDEVLRKVGLLESLSENSLVAVMLVVFMLMNLLLSPIQVQMPYLAKFVFDGSFNSLALMEIAIGGGVLAGGVILSIISIRQKTLLYSFVFLVGLCLSFLAFQVSRNLYTAAVSLMAMGVFVGLANILIINIFQSEPEAKHIPNIMSLVNFISAAAVPLSLIGVGALQTLASIEKIGFFSAVALVIVCLASYLPFRKFGKELM